MKIIEPSATLVVPSVDQGVDCLRFIEKMARISHKSEDAQTDNSWRRFIDAVVLQHGDWSVTEHASATVLFRVDRGITHELVRHRLFSFTQESTRFVNGRKAYPDGLEFIQPAGFEDMPYSSTVFESHCKECENAYLHVMESETIRPQEARSLLPNALASTIGMTGNLRSWRWFFLARTTKEAHPDMRRVTVPLLSRFQECIPMLYDDIKPLQKQSISMAKVH